MRFGHVLAFPKQPSAHRRGCIVDTENVDPPINPETGVFAPAPLGPKPHPTLSHFVKVLRALGIPEIGRAMWEGETPGKKALPKTPRVAKSKARSALYLAPIPGGPGDIAQHGCTMEGGHLASPRIQLCLEGHLLHTHGQEGAGPVCVVQHKLDCNRPTASTPQEILENQCHLLEAETHG